MSKLRKQFYKIILMGNLSYAFTRGTKLHVFTVTTMLGVTEGK